MDETVVVACAEELAEVKGFFILHIVAHERPKVVGVDVDGRQRFVGVQLARVDQVPFGLSTLLHHVVPREDFVLAVVVEEVEGRARELQHLRLGL